MRIAGLKSPRTNQPQPARFKKRSQQSFQEAPASAIPTQNDRSRWIDPTTCERDYSADEVEFMQALDQYKHSNGRMFPTCSEILEVVRLLGYTRIASA